MINPTYIKCLKLIHEQIKLKNGTLVSIDSQSISKNTYITIKCHNTSHSTWKVSFDNLTRLKTWCPQCAGRFSPEENIHKAKLYAESRGGYYLSGEYKNQTSKLTFKCGNINHKPWTISFNKIISNKTWCQKCRIEEGQLKTLDIAKEHAISKGGLCLSNTYKARDKLLWKCSNSEHKPWLSTYGNVVNTNKWCPQCAGFFSPEEWIKKAQKYAINKGGMFLSNEHSDVHQLHNWKCAESSHPSWKASISNVINNNTWCPECNSSRNIRESYSRVILEELLGFKLNRQKPKWNLNPNTNCLLELDGYNEEHKFAFEFQGRQHFQENVFSNSNLADIQKRDLIKQENCKNNGVFLLIINFDNSKKTPEKIINQITNLLDFHKISYKLDTIKIIEKIKNLYLIKDGFSKNFINN